MELHKTLYKERTQILTTRQHSKLNRQLQETHRNQQRKDRFQDSRNISLSPKPPHRTEVMLQINREDKENGAVDVTNQSENPDNTRVVKLVCHTTNTQKLSRQEDYVKRYIEWKDKKKEMAQKQATANKKKPFLSAVSSGRQTSSCSIVPEGHHKEFRPPAGLKNPLDTEKVEENVKAAPPKGRQSVYTVVPTPPRKTKPTNDKKINKFPIARKAIPTNLHKQILYNNNFENNKTPQASAAATLNSLSKSNNKPTTSLNKLNNEPKSTSKFIGTQKPQAKLAVKNLVTAFDKTKSTVKTQPAIIKPVDRTKLKPKALNMPPPPLPATRTTTVKHIQITSKKTEDPPTKPTTRRDGAVGKLRNIPSKRVTTTKPLKKSPLKSGGARLAQNLKAKKPANASKKITNPSLQLHGKKLLNLITTFEPASAEMIIQTPKDFAHQNPFDEFVTSTKLRNSSQATDDLEGISPIESFEKRSHGNSSAKRILLNDINPIISDKQEKDKQKDTITKKVDVLEKVGKKFNFIRYSEAANLSYKDSQKDHDEDDNNQNTDNEAAANGEIDTNLSLLGGDITLIQTSLREEEKTPTKSGPEERPSNYLSPFVSVARGKVSLKREKEKRNSVYLQQPLESKDTAIENPASPRYSVEVRRTLEAVNYFRKQLQAEIARLIERCDIWELYKNENLEQIQNANGEDMINVTIGQTRLLTSKKFMQFKGLIDRCEAGATGINFVPSDGSEATKPITAVDLEGFWSMLGIQVDNLDKRFDNLNLWKSNNWQDPDEIKPKTKKNLTKVKKAKSTITAKAKPNTALQQMLRNMRKNKNNNKNDDDENVVLTPSKLKHSSRLSSNNLTLRKSGDKFDSPRRLSIVVKDRKYFSPAATVLSMNSSQRRSSILQRKSSQDSPKMLKYVQTFNEALETMELSNDLRKSALINGNMNSKRMSLNPQSPFNAKNNRKTSLDSPSMKKNSNSSEDLLKTALLNGGNGGNPQATPQSPLSSPAPTARKSILKTPGTAKSRLRNVIFNEKLRVKKFNFMVNEDEGDSLHPNNGDDPNNSHEEDLAKSNDDAIQADEDDDDDAKPRTLSLRNRKVRLRPSCEIVIPTQH